MRTCTLPRSGKGFVVGGRVDAAADESVVMAGMQLAGARTAHLF
jgi:hypothetical protein